MPTASSAFRVFFSVAERSADLYAASLISEFRRRHPESTFFGLSGPLSCNAGAETFHDMTTGAAMLVGALGRVPEAWWVLQRLKRSFRESPPDAAVLIDSPALNLPLAKLCKRFQVPVLYYVAPQTWAWAEGRVAKIRDRVDKLAVILPFEEDYFRRHGIAARFVGHPLFESLEAAPLDEARLADFAARGLPLIALMPGSRRQVVHEVFPGQVEIAVRIAHHFPEAYFLVAAASPQTEDIARAITSRLSRAGLAVPLQRFFFDHRFRPEMIAAADLALVASGTATLEVAYHATPMIVMYNHGRLLYPFLTWAFNLFGRKFLRTPRLSLPNIIAGRDIVPEFMPFYVSVEPIAEQAIAMLSDTAGLESRQRELAELIAPLVRTDVSAAVADELEQLLASRKR
ncbi:MAG: hypothetical protein HUU22_09385 [Phycisphaerae bacterium]|nr:hypothetical protein [Phycisphaerae bacterium]NUQ46233.1 hypothetical protein [Phycisphaerae bacterium]